MTTAGAQATYKERRVLNSLRTSSRSSDASGRAGFDADNPQFVPEVESRATAAAATDTAVAANAKVEPEDTILVALQTVDLLPVQDHRLTRRETGQCGLGCPSAMRIGEPVEFWPWCCTATANSRS